MFHTVITCFIIPYWKGIHTEVYLFFNHVSSMIQLYYSSLHGLYVFLLFISPVLNILLPISITDIHEVVVLGLTLITSSP